MILNAIERMAAASGEPNRDVVIHSDDDDDSGRQSWRKDLEFTIQKVTHQMNNAFTVLRGKAELGLRKSDPSCEASKFSEILEVLSSVESLNKELMSFGKALAEHPFIPVDIMDLIRRRVFAHTALFHEADARVCIKNAEQALYLVSTCEEPLVHILDNILINAIQGVADARGREKEITITAGSKDEHIVVQVSDNGIGMSAGTLAKAGTNGFTTKPNGNGLGLFITNRLCQVINASLQLESREGQGTCARLTLPKHEENGIDRAPGSKNGNDFRSSIDHLWMDTKE
jgi:signal transduction histidine kinase